MHTRTTTNHNDRYVVFYEFEAEDDGAERVAKSEDG